LKMLNINQVLPHFCSKKTQLARALGISKQAVTKWPGGVLPELQELKIRYELLPHIDFDVDQQLRDAS